MPKIAAIIVAAGRGTRLGGEVAKQYRKIAGRAVLGHTLTAIADQSDIARIVVVIHPDDDPYYRDVIAALPMAVMERLAPPVPGGATRQLSVMAGLESLASEEQAPAFVLVHDAARPFVSRDLVGRAVAAGIAHAAAVPGVKIADTIKRVDENGTICETPDRDLLRRVQTPQAFAFAPLLVAHRRAVDAGLTGFTDDGTLAEWAGHSVHIFDGEAGNMKITSGEDIVEAERRLTPSTTLISRAGIGYDVHAFGPGDHIWIGGLRLPHDQGVIAHSDGDVALHALTDAVFGAMADGDIGSHFPPSDPRWRGAASDQFLAHAVKRLRARGGQLDHLDLTIICEAPKIGPHRDAMRARIAAIVDVPISSVSVKATTSEQLGFTGRREGIAAQAVASVRLPEGT
ncbi:MULTISPECIES: bifunctional 2-C-methyl-D-erythritol 4-phosphate cytidylyltransferase/2-C-methyl-D-erythritol 2,4-cyclodiphosphate synthase [unclassified Chelatococcus]|uniref:bifunctional 2-C-methyl-D-erythritol 4-phosphate cytidylyltransferase/2-C-methyl-D-erythritol 2,4-cyclodiphosphate synthase n=1 Tax=unclassified Chelatococcus TaxID=2638111 RepID=UPI001BCEB98E|nr:MULTISPECIES: bifunctional 2-C-methyl-D-erythritol 4-phosphate cytidylyltransferase/2-C-methyl-D-erythritol 2,4-cyclodiphosphate synthase [unclassified Chelatococcus]CAH1672650.1 2-C-methyl-D-erythritol 4-phosphate cytidylyltransferase / 2-C-methyl-D-erythritol 2,4-cyclodiphosphate synthase [Hyphomicrobiales bacterium]MBS7738616.1 bifunctional 2-C-methyl-D-erythritol 4-phosphate cytidylyltransferase/2-C-methyl-D-erythritol 2,4-cyclodiphosphate synthase [Chelatococcus sp. HY11]MBX3543020.1 bif